MIHVGFLGLPWVMSTHVATLDPVLYLLLHPFIPLLNSDDLNFMPCWAKLGIYFLSKTPSPDLRALLKFCFLSFPLPTTVGCGQFSMVLLHMSYKDSTSYLCSRLFPRMSGERTALEGTGTTSGVGNRFWLLKPRVPLLYCSPEYMQVSSGPLHFLQNLGLRNQHNANTLTTYIAMNISPLSNSGMVFLGWGGMRIKP